MVSAKVRFNVDSSMCKVARESKAHPGDLLLDSAGSGISRDNNVNTHYEIIILCIRHNHYTLHQTEGIMIHAAAMDSCGSCGSAFGTRKGQMAGFSSSFATFFPCNV